MKLLSTCFWWWDSIPLNETLSRDWVSQMIFLPVGDLSKLWWLVILILYILTILLSGVF